MRVISILWIVVALPFGPLPLAQGADRPLARHPENSHYFLFRGQPAVLITSGEHYGAVLNRDFDYIRYLDTLQKAGFNLTRTFSGAYREIPGSFNIVENTLAPRADHYLCPWPRSKSPGAGDGLAKFDLHSFEPAYFERLRDFVSQAGKRGIVVELSLFCAIYDDKLWQVHPFRAGNNLQGIGKHGRLEVYNLRERELTAVQEALVRRIVRELKDCDNLYYEICNEPYFGGVTEAWNDRMVAVLSEAEKDLSARHLLAQNIANGSKKIEHPNPAIGLFHFHYATPPDTVALNWSLHHPLGDDETGFRGTSDEPYRQEGWEFLLTGGALYSNLDYSFSCSHPDGTLKVTTSPGGGGPALRRQLGVLKQFMSSLDFIHMQPDNRIIKQVRPHGQATGGEKPPVARALVQPGKTYALFVRGGRQVELDLDLSRAEYELEWINTHTGTVELHEKRSHPGGTCRLVSPAYDEDIALRIRAR